MSSVQNVGIIITLGIWEGRVRRKSSVRKGLQLKKKKKDPDLFWKGYEPNCHRTERSVIL